MSGQPTPAFQNNDSIGKLAAVIKPLLDAVAEQINNRTTAQIQEVLIKIGTLELQMNRFEQLLAEKKVSIPREKKVAQAAPTGDSSVATTPSVGQPPKAFPNRMRWFYEQYAEDAEFRAAYTPEDATRIIDTDPICTNDKLTPKKRHEAMSKICWNVISKEAKYKALIAQYDAIYATAKSAASTVIQPTQEKVEPNTPIQ